MNVESATLHTTEPHPLAFAWRNPLARALLAGQPDLASCYPFGLGWQRLDEALAARSQQAWQADRSAVVASLWEHLGEVGLRSAQEANLDRLARADAVVVVTGQQPGFLGGPLYSLYKAMTTIWAADHLRAQGHNAVPVFWSATEDDDFAEVATAWALDRGDSLRSLTMPAAHRPGQPVGGLRLAPDDWARIAAELAECLPPGDGTEWLLAELDACWGQQPTLGEGFARWLTALLGERGLLLLDPSRPALRRAGAPFFARVLDDPLCANRAAGQVGARLTALGFEPAVHRTEDLCPFYVLSPDGLRERLRWDGNGFQTADGGAYAAADLRAMADGEPERFSTGVLLRPALQDWLLPTAAFVVGPGEAAYMAQVSAVDQAYGIAPPLLLPRFSATVIEPRVARALETYGLSLDDIDGDLDHLVARVAREHQGLEATERFALAWQAASTPLSEVGAWAVQVDASLSGVAEGLLNKLRAELGKLEEKVQRALRQQDETLRRRLSTAVSHLAPGGTPQERKLSALNLLARQGPSAVEAIYSALAAHGCGEHVVVRWTR